VGAHARHRGVTTPAVLTPPAAGRAHARPPVAGDSPHRKRFLCRADPCGSTGISAGPVLGFPRYRVDLQAGCCALLRSHRSPRETRNVVSTGQSLVLATNLCCFRASVSRPFAGCLGRRLRRAFTPGKLPSLRPIGATRSARSVHVVRFPPRRFSPRAGFQGIAPGTGPGSVPFRPRSPVDRIWLPRHARRGHSRGLPATSPHTPRRTRFPCACAPGTRTLDPLYRVTAAVAPVPFSRLRGVVRALEASASRPSLPTAETHIVLPWALFPFEALRLDRSRSSEADFTASTVSASIPPLARRLSGRGR
jgi:hypothetical protein